MAARLPNNPAVRFERIDGKDELIVSPLDKVEEPASLVARRTAIAGRWPRVDLPEILLEIAARTDVAVAFTHVSERAARVTDLGVSVCAVLLAEACNTGLEPLVRHETQRLRRDRLSWVSQHYLRDETLRAAHTGIPLAHAWGGGEVASADGLRFVVPVRTGHAGPTPSTSVSAGASPTTTSCPISAPACTALRSRGRCATAWYCSRSRSNSRQRGSPRRS